MAFEEIAFEFRQKFYYLWAEHDLQFHLKEALKKSKFIRK